jgi:hypothetical protein
MQNRKHNKIVGHDIILTVDVCGYDKLNNVELYAQQVFMTTALQLLFCCFLFDFIRLFGFSGKSLPPGLVSATVHNTTGLTTIPQCGVRSC